MCVEDAGGGGGVGEVEAAYMMMAMCVGRLDLLCVAWLIYDLR